jgi:hypothetical protein
MLRSRYAPTPWQCASHTDAQQIQPQLRTRSSAFFIEGMFYEDARAPASARVELGAPVVRWAAAKQRQLANARTHHSSGRPNPAHISGQMPWQERMRAGGDMAATRFEDIEIQLGKEYLFMHQGSCEHVMIFRRLRGASVRETRRYSRDDYPRNTLVPHKVCPAHGLAGTFLEAGLTEIDLCGVCSCQEILRHNGRKRCGAPVPCARSARRRGCASATGWERRRPPSTAATASRGCTQPRSTSATARRATCRCTTSTPTHQCTVSEEHPCAPAAEVLLNPD